MRINKYIRMAIPSQVPQHTQEVTLMAIGEPDLAIPNFYTYSKQNLYNKWLQAMVVPKQSISSFFSIFLSE